ncbi:MAG: L-fucose/L-arabinose isomerase family protein [Ruminococcus sp.]|nr:L-fucose/L-arabinose isomerase family protein [Ruminococcus sp.]
MNTVLGNMPKVKLGLAAVSRDCFPMSLSEARRNAVAKAYGEKYDAEELFVCPTVIENEKDMRKALGEINAAGCNALVVYLGNFGPETPETLLAKYFDGPAMFAAAAEDDCGDALIDNRGDAYCGMLNASYNLKLRGIKAYIPDYPVGTADEVADMINGFIPIARAVIGLKNLKIISFGPRPQDFLACNAPIARLYDLGVEIEENSELDLFAAFNEHAGDERIPALVDEMAEELGSGNKMSGILPKLAQYELTLTDWAEEHRGERAFVAFANKCWPSFQTQFGFVPCYVNGRLGAKGIPVSCEVDIYGVLSEYIGQCVSGEIVTLLDINNTVPGNIYREDIEGKFDYTQRDTFMGFHCGNGSACIMNSPVMKFQRIMHRGLEPDKEPDITRGTLEGDIKPGDITFFRLQSTADAELRAYAAEGEILPVPTRSFGTIGIFAIKEMARFYRYVLIEKGYPHHGCVVFGKNGKALFDLLDYLGVEDREFNRPANFRYHKENPYK